MRQLSKLIYVVLINLSIVMHTVAAQNYQQLPEVELYPESLPSLKNWPGKIDKPVQEISMYEGEVLFNVVEPSILPFIPKKELHTDTAALIFPGGGFRQVSIKSEGTRVAEWLAERGVAAFVVKYRTVQLPGPDYHLFQRMHDFPFAVSAEPALEDGKVALNFIRKNAEKYGINPQRVVTIGFSAGAHIAVHLALDKKLEQRPDYAALIYGAPFDAKMPKVPAKRSKEHLPPIFLAMSQDDYTVGDVVRKFYAELLDKDYHPEAHFFMRGDHGHGMRKQGTTSDHFIDLLYWWMEAHQLTQVDQKK